MDLYCLNPLNHVREWIEARTDLPRMEYVVRDPELRAVRAAMALDRPDYVTAHDLGLLGMRVSFEKREPPVCPACRGAGTVSIATFEDGTPTVDTSHACMACGGTGVRR
jgi:hypothetical protein